MPVGAESSVLVSLLGSLSRLFLVISSGFVAWYGVFCCFSTDCL